MELERLRGKSAVALFFRFAWRRFRALPNDEMTRDSGRYQAWLGSAGVAGARSGTPQRV